MKNFRRQLRRNATLVALSASLIACPAAAGNPTSTLQRIQSSGTVRMGVANEIPFGYLGPNGELKGESAGTARMVFKLMGIKHFDGTITKFGGLIPALKAQRFDIAAAGMYITPDRCRQVDFSIPNYSLGEGFLVAKGNPHKLHSFKDFTRHPALKITVVSGAIEDTYAQKAGIKQSQIRYAPDRPTAMQDVLNGRSAAFAGTSLTVARLARMNSRLSLATPFHNPVINGHTIRGYGAFAFRKSDDALRKAFNERLRQVHHTKKWQRFMQTIGFSKADLAAAEKASTDALCKGD